VNHSLLVSNPLKSPLARRLIIAIVLFSAAIVVTMTAIQIYQEYRRALDNLESQFQQISEVHLRSLTQSLWATNNNEVQIQLEGMLRVPNIVYAAVHEKDRLHAQAGHRDSVRMIERRYPMRYEYQGQLHEIGTLTVVATLDNIYQQLLREATQVLLRNALRTFLVAIFVFVLFQRLITRHLATVIEHLRNADPATAAAPLALARAPRSEPDELDVLVSATNDMQAKAHATLDALRDSEVRVRLLLDSTSEAIYGVDTEGVCTFANPACVFMLGYGSENDLIGKRMHELIHHTHPDGQHYPIEECAVRIATLAGQACHRNDEVHWRADGSSFPVEYWSHPMTKDGELVGTVVAFIDINERKQAEAELHRLAYYDNLTGLPNRILFSDRVFQALAEAKRRNRFVALMMLDMDRFKVVNDTMGHEAGDALLREIAARLKRSIRETDTVSRLGGDEFALLFTDITDIQHVAHLADLVLAQFATPIPISGREIFSGASIGVVLYPTDAEDAESLLKFADSAMYHAKESGRNNYQFYSREMTASAQGRLRLETELRRAVERGELYLHYQPQIDSRSGRITGVEALLRWQDSAGDSIAPAQFIPLAEETGLIVPIGKWVLETACGQLKRWHDAGYKDIVMSVNVASRQFRDQLFHDTVRQAIASSGIPPAALELEITESILLENSEGTRHTLQEIKALGASLAIDDFGTGYSSLSYLKRFPIDRLKIDQSFVRDLVIDGEDLAIVKAIIALAHAMRLRVIAEGVETAEQLALLKSEGCHDYQGYFFARPMNADRLTTLLSSQPLPEANAGT
jgi:diguanylate cyclase (GGDEF)-like protein/PAS domain S-box-containing protein